MISIKTREEIQYMREAGHLNYMAREYIKSLIVPGITTLEIDKKAEEYIRSIGGVPGFKGYGGFPGSICISVNDEVVHGIPSKRKLRDGDVVSIDIGVEYKGYHSDSANTYIVGHASREIKDLVENTKKSLYEGLSVIKDGVKISDIGSKIENFAKNNNLGVVRELVGHGVGSSIHEDPDVPNYYTNDNTRLKSGMVIAVEPMLNLGTRHIYMEEDEWTIKTEDGLASAHFEHTVLVTKDGYVILTGE